MPLKLVRHTERSPHWYIRGSVRGQRVFETTGTNDKSAAEAILIKRQSEILDRAVFGPGATVTFAEAGLSYIEEGGEKRFLGRFDDRTQKWTLLIGHFGTKPIARIGQAEIDAAAFKLLPNAKAATRKRQVYIPMAAVLHHAARKGWCIPPRFSHPRVPIPETKWSTPERLGQLLPYCNQKLRRLVIFLVYTGVRITEALQLDWERDMRLAERAAHVRRTKNGKMRTVYLPDSVLIALAEIPEAERIGQVFKWRARHAVYGPLKRACKKAGVEYLPPHQQGRHTWASWLRIYARRDLKGLKEDGGWESLQSVERYAHVAAHEAGQAADLLPSVVIAPVIGNTFEAKLGKIARAKSKGDRL